MSISRAKALNIQTVRIREGNGYVFLEIKYILSSLSQPTLTYFFKRINLFGDGEF